ncbi:hypothetical protein VQ643_09100 [Pseudomonas sp. F1_0610]|uniref:hypothetical protein n=1 Tax=Pseudomonas sp. F1_0610 TaxID=3114284 RepID=UPI0039C1C07C
MNIPHDTEDLDVAIAFLQRRIRENNSSQQLVEQTAKHLNDMLSINKPKAQTLAWQALHIVESEHQQITPSVI